MFVRYDIPDERGETRRARNARFGQPAPKPEIPPPAAHVWGWFWALSNRRRSGPEPLTYAEVGEWQRLTGTPVRPEEVEMIMRMDDAYLDETRKEQRAAVEREREKSRR
ncbi:phage tail assembly chaperone [Coralloluteibacterium thermophilus]|uniref:Uncharacterized protein n=1 Tax=Coralloluteibacterium thermophilum TaxID=2707049 RepID=A0ABV9NQF8_9GAMM